MTVSALHPRVKARVLARRELMTARRELLPAEVLAGHYVQFRSRFGPERLTPEMLAADPSDPGSLSFWLQRKDDEELPDAFGPLRLRVNCLPPLDFDPSRGGWTEGRGEAASRERVMSVAGALHHDLMKAVRRVDAMPSDAGDTAYAELQRDLARAAPGMERTPWAHKYLAMLFPEKLDQFHEGESDLVLMKCLEVPPGASEGLALYENSGGLPAIAGDLGMPTNHLCVVLSELVESSGWCHQLLEVDEGQWETMVEGDYVGIGWPLLGDLRTWEWSDFLDADSRGAAAIKEHYPGADPGEMSDILRRFAWEIPREGLLIIHSGREVLGITQVAGPYYFVDGPLAHRRPVRLLDDTRWLLSEEDTALLQLAKVRNRRGLVVEVERRLMERAA